MEQERDARLHEEDEYDPQDETQTTPEAEEEDYGADADEESYDYDDEETDGEEEEEYEDEEEGEEEDEDDDEPGFGQNVLSFIKGVVAVILILAVLIFGLRVLDEKKIVSCAWFRDHLGSVGTMLFGEAPQGENVQ